VAGPTNPNVVTLPALVQGDTLTLNVYLLTRNASYPLSNPFTILNNAGLTLQMAIGDKVGNATNYYATQFIWAADAANQYFTAQLALNTAAITALLGANSSAQAWLHVEYLQGGLPTTVLERQVTLQAAVIKAGGNAPLPPGLTPLSAEYANATFLTRQIVGAVVWVSPAGKKFAQYCDDDGTVHVDPVQ